MTDVERMRRCLYLQRLRPEDIPNRQPVYKPCLLYTSVVSAEDNEPIVGASVLVKGTTLGTITDMNGRYSINNIPVNAKSVSYTHLDVYKRQGMAVNTIFATIYIPNWYEVMQHIQEKWLTKKK